MGHQSWSVILRVRGQTRAKGQCLQPSGAPVGPGGGLPRARDRTEWQNVVRPHISLLLVRQLERMTGGDDKMPSALVLEFHGRAVTGKYDKPHNLRHIQVGDSRGRRGTAGDHGKTVENNRKQQKTGVDGGRRRGTAWEGWGGWGAVWDSPSLGCVG